MPGKIKSAKQFRFLESAAHSGAEGIMPSTAQKMLSHESHDTKSKFAKESKGSKFAKGLKNASKRRNSK